jgi:hypothetical protein
MSRQGRRGSLRPALERDGPDDHLVVDGSQGSADEGADPEDPMVAPGVLPVVDDGSAKAPSWVDASASNGDGSKVDQEHSKPNWQWSKDLFSPNKDFMVSIRTKHEKYVMKSMHILSIS